MKLKDISELIVDANENRGKPVIRYGIPYLDDATGGIRQNDLVVIGGRTGAGKTTICSILAEKASQANKNVVVFNLEAEKGEFANRILFRDYAKEFYNKHQKGVYYREFVNNRITDRLLYNKVESATQVKLMQLQVFEREDTFTIDDFAILMSLIPASTDLIILDHLHHFDTNTSDEVQELKKTVKSIRDLCLLHNKPVVLIAHFRKGDRNSSQLVPDLEEFHGSSEISKEATQVITMSRYDEVDIPAYLCPTLFKVCKLRIDGSVARFVGKHYFNAQNNEYEDLYTVNKLLKSGTQLDELGLDMCPHWSRLIN